MTHIPRQAARLWDKGAGVDELVHRFTVGDDPALDRHLLHWDCLGSAAHALALARANLLSADELAGLLRGLATIDALNAYVKVRGPAGSETNCVFLYRHERLSPSYLSERLRTYGERCGVKATPHQLRHTCATLLLNAGAPILTVQTILGHRHVDTTLGYARLYDGTVATDYYRAMAQVEQRFAAQDGASVDPPSVNGLLALVDSLRNGTLSESQREAVQALRYGILSLLT